MRELNLEEFVDEIYEDCQNNSDSKYLFFLGAGCSKSSGIPLASELTEQWYEKLKNKKQNLINLMKNIRFLSLIRRIFQSIILKYLKLYSLRH